MLFGRLNLNGPSATKAADYPVRCMNDAAWTTFAATSQKACMLDQTRQQVTHSRLRRCSL
eukprot:6191998-Pleurochrysis_carterae.AAC.2